MDVPNQTYWCIACKEEFPSQKALDQHNTTMLARGIRGHVQCPKCTYVADHDKGKALHMRSCHPVLQSLTCPACNQGPYRKVEDFVHHIEKGRCGVLTLDKIDDMRRELVLPSRAISAAQGFQQRDDFSEYFGLNRGDVFPSQRLSERPCQENWDDWTAEPTTPESAAKEALPTVEQVANKGPQLDINGEPRDPDLEYDEWGRPVLPEDENKEPEVISLLPPWKNLKPGATVADCWNGYSGLYKCPCFMPNICLKTFPTARKLINHIKAQHNERVYRCPCCMKGYQSLQSLASHTTSYGKFCKFRRDDLFDNFIEQLVGGMIIAERERNEDGTRNFRISDRALKQFGQKRVPGCATVDDDKTAKTAHNKRTSFGKSGTNQYQSVVEKSNHVEKDAGAADNKRDDESTAWAQYTDPDDDLMAESIDWDEWDRKFETTNTKLSKKMEESCYITVTDEAKSRVNASLESSRPDVVRIPKPPKFEVPRIPKTPRIPKPPRPEEFQVHKEAVGQVGNQGSKDGLGGNTKDPWGNQKPGVSKPDVPSAGEGSVPLAENHRRKNQVPNQKLSFRYTASRSGVCESSNQGSLLASDLNHPVQQNRRSGFKNQWPSKKASSYGDNKKPRNSLGVGKQSSQYGSAPKQINENSIW